MTAATTYGGRRRTSDGSGRRARTRPPRRLSGYTPYPLLPAAPATEAGAITRPTNGLGPVSRSPMEGLPAVKLRPLTTYGAPQQRSQSSAGMNSAQWQRSMMRRVYGQSGSR